MFEHSGSAFEDLPETLFENKDAVHGGYRPSWYPEREDEVEEYAHILSDVLRGDRPGNVFLYGVTGTGKTDITRWMLDDLHDRANDGDRRTFEYVYVNCEDLQNSYQVVRAIANDLREQFDEWVEGDPDGVEEFFDLSDDEGPATLIRDPISATGHPPADMYKKMWREIEKWCPAETVIVVLDEVDAIDDDEILYELSRARKNDNVEDTKLSIIGISNDLGVEGALRPKVRSSLTENKIKFSPYDATQLQRILAVRAVEAYKGTTATDYEEYEADPTDCVYDDEKLGIVVESSVIDSAVIYLSAAYGAKKDGDARAGIELVRKAGEVAERDDADTVERTHVETAKQDLERDLKEDTIADLPEHGQLTLLSTALLESQDRTPARTKEIFRVYRTVVDHIDRAEDRSLRLISEDLDELEMLGYLEKDDLNLGRKGGRSNVYEMDFDPVDALTILQRLGNSDRTTWGVDEQSDDPAIPDAIAAAVSEGTTPSLDAFTDS